MIKEIDQIDTNTEEGKLLLNAIAKISTESERDKTPDQIIEQLQELQEKKEEMKEVEKKKDNFIGGMEYLLDQMYTLLTQMSDENHPSSQKNCFKDALKEIRQLINGTVTSDFCKPLKTQP
jgi:non-homologous end joining protein Ku